MRAAPLLIPITVVVAAFPVAAPALAWAQAHAHAHTAASASRQARLGAQAAAGRVRAGAAAARLGALNAREATLAARIGANRSELIRLLGALERWRADPPPALLVSPGRAVDAARGALLMRAVTPELERRARALAGQARALNAVRRQAAEADAAVFAAESAAADAQEAADALAPGGAAGLEAALLTPAERAARARARADLGADLGAEPGGARRLARAGPAPPPERLDPPAPGAPILRWGDPWPGRGPAQGWVWSPPAGAEVRSPATGRVEYVGPLKGFRLVAILRLEGEWRVVLAGLQTVTAPAGARVRAGQPIGRAAAGPARALYLQLRDGARAVDPAPQLAGPAPPR